MATVGEPFLSPIPTGWKCPVCGKVNAPWVQQCPCAGGPFTYPTCPPVTLPPETTPTPDTTPTIDC